ncbi:unnamed protein product [Echinostoma caproni]|uniref:Uncharacterized protein n=1 Tax=Echinostoma caproni TaxID=27848 RepID=A0A183A5N3_9TREM|nr:unnamed protein product [Echinostoma caproni]
MKEHHRRWLSRGGSGSITSAILAHLVDTGHRVDPSEAFGIIYQVPADRSKYVRMRTLAIAEAICNRHLTPELWAQKGLIQALHLPWIREPTPPPCSPPCPHKQTFSHNNTDPSELGHTIVVTLLQTPEAQI